MVATKNCTILVCKVSKLALGELGCATCGLETELLKVVDPGERMIIETFMNLKNGGSVRFREMSEELFAWAKRWISEA